MNKLLLETLITKLTTDYVVMNITSDKELYYLVYVDDEELVKEEWESYGTLPDENNDCIKQPIEINKEEYDYLLKKEKENG